MCTGLNLTGVYFRRVYACTQVNMRLVMLEFTSALVAAAGSEELQQQVRPSASLRATRPVCLSARELRVAGHEYGPIVRMHCAASKLVSPLTAAAYCLYAAPRTAGDCGRVGAAAGL